MTSIRVAVLLLTAFSLSFSNTQKCKCLPAPPEATTNWGQENVVLADKRVVNSLTGRVVEGNRELSMGGVLVEVYDKPEVLLMDGKERETKKLSQRRVAACVTGTDGEFCFPDIPPGKYELRCSEFGWNLTSVYVIVSPKKQRRNNSKLIVSLQLSH